MIVDDENFNLLAIKGLMKVLGMPATLDNVDFCFNGKQAVQLIQ